MPPDSRDALLAMTDDELLGQSEVDRLRGSGPGGQKRNVTESAVRIRHLPTGLRAQSDETRSQHQNRRIALRKLRRQIALQLREPVDVAHFAPPRELTELVTSRAALGGKRLDANLPALAVLLDLFAALGGVMSEAAERLGTTTGGLSRIITSSPELTQAANRVRAEHGLRPLRAG